MAELRRITRNSVISNFQQVAPEAGGVFRVAKQALDTAYERLAPAATDIMKEQGTEAGRAWARSQIGDPLVATGGGKSYRDAIKTIESSGNYQAQGPATPSGDRAYGAYQVMGSNVGPWTEKHLGRRMTPQEFLADPAAQDTVFDAEFGSYVSKHGNAQDAASMWFSGRPLAKAGNASDGMTTVPEYVKRFNDLTRNVPVPTVIRTSAGKLEPRLFSPMSGEILQAYNAASAVAYNSEVMLKGVTDMMAMSDQFALDPNGFKTAAQGYVDQLVAQAPQQFRTDLRTSLEKEMTRRFLGVMEDQQRDTRQRADNSSAALVDRWSDNLAEAKASGNKDEIDSATAELGSLLSARESLPGVAWTPEQSANVFRDVDKKAEAIRKQATAKADQGIKDQLDTIAKAASSGMHGADESILDDPSVAAKFPDQYRNAQVGVYIRDNLGSFRTATPAQQAGAIAEAKSIPVSDEGQVAIVKGLEDIHAATKKALADDPIKWAAENLQDKPPPLPSFDAGSPKAFIDALKARADFGRKMATDGYTKTPAFLTNAEAEAVGALMGKDVDPAIKTLLSGAIVEGFGSDAASVFREVKSDDPVTRFAGMMVARGGDQATATMAMRGQQMLDQGLVQAPTKATSVAAISTDIAVALGASPAADQAQGDILKYATAIYAADARGVDPNSEASKSLMERSIQTALGQSTDRNGILRGGVQTIGDQPVLLPVGISGESIEAGLRKGMARPQPSMWDILAGQAPNADAPFEGEAEFWKGIGTSMPMLGGKPVPYSMISKGIVRLAPVSGTTYRMEVVIDGAAKTDIRDSNGNLFTVDITKLADAGL